MQTTIKIDYKAFCEQYIDNIKTIYGLNDKDVENLPLDLPVILKWVEKIQENDLREHLRNGDLEYVEKMLEVM